MVTVYFLPFLILGFAVGYVRGHLLALRQDRLQERVTTNDAATLIATSTGLALAVTGLSSVVFLVTFGFLGIQLKFWTRFGDERSWLYAAIAAAVPTLFVALWLGWKWLAWSDDSPAKKALAQPSERASASSWQGALGTGLAAITVVAIALVSWQVVGWWSFCGTLLLIPAAVRAYWTYLRQFNLGLETSWIDMIRWLIESLALLMLLGTLLLCVAAAMVVSYWQLGDSTLLFGMFHLNFLLWVGTWAGWVLLRIPEPGGDQSQYDQEPPATASNPPTP